MGTNYYAVKKKPTIASPLHIGKSSSGWKFLFHEVKIGYCDYDYELEIHTCEQWEKFLKSNNEIIILNEYDEEISVNDFLELVNKKQSENNEREHNDNN